MNAFFKYCLLLTFATGSIRATAQNADQQRGNLPNYYHQRLHFGFALGIIRPNFMITPVEHFERLDSLKAVTTQKTSGFSLGIVSELMLHQYVTLRFLPSLSFADRNVDFFFEGKKDTIAKTKKIESTFLNFPLLVKLRSKRVENFGAYIIAGGAYNLDLASKRKVSNENIELNDQILKLKRDDFSIEGGVGAEFYLEYFKFGIEAKMGLGITDVLIHDNTIFSNSIDKLKSKVFTISLTFEG